MCIRDRNWLFDFEYKKFGIPAPDAVVYLAVDPEVSQRLITERYHGDESKRDIQAVSYTHLDVYKRQGYDRAKYGFDCETCGVITTIDGQSPDIALGTNCLLYTSRPQACWRMTAGPSSTPSCLHCRALM